MRLTKTQQVTTSFFPTPAEQNTTGKQQQLFTSALCEHQEDFARETREGKWKKERKKKKTPWQQHLEICTSMFFALKSGASVERNENIMSAVQASTTPRWGWVEAVTWLVSTSLRNGTPNGTPVPCSLLRQTFPTNRTSWISSGATLSTQNIASTQYIGPNLTAWQCNRNQIGETQKICFFSNKCTQQWTSSSSKFHKNSLQNSSRDFKAGYSTQRVHQ